MDKARSTFVGERASKMGGQPKRDVNQEKSRLQIWTIRTKRMPEVLECPNPSGQPNLADGQTKRLTELNRPSKLRDQPTQRPKQIPKAVLISNSQHEVFHSVLCLTRPHLTYFPSDHIKPGCLLGHVN
jgi:hypothetical protein